MKPMEPASLAKLKFPRHELFAQAVAAGETPAGAYERIYAVNSVQAKANGYRLMGRPEIAKRVEQLQAVHAASQSVSVASLTDMLVQTFRLATITKQSAAAAQSVMGIAKLHGLLIDKTQVDAIVRRPAMIPDSPDEMSEAAWLSQYAITKVLGFDADTNSDIIDVDPEAEAGTDLAPEIDEEEFRRLFGESESVSESASVKPKPEPEAPRLKAPTLDLDQ